MKHFTWHHHQTIFKRTSLPLIRMLMYWQFTVKKLTILTIHTTHTFDLDQGDGQGALVVFVNSDSKIKTSGQTPPKVTTTLHMESLSSLLGTWTCPSALASLDVVNLDPRFHALAVKVSRYLIWTSFICLLSLTDVKLPVTLF